MTTAWQVFERIGIHKATGMKRPNEMKRRYHRPTPHPTILQGPAGEELEHVIFDDFRCRAARFADPGEALKSREALKLCLRNTEPEISTQRSPV